MNDERALLMEPVIGWRAWHVVKSYGTWQLISPQKDVLWTPGQPTVALCRHDGGCSSCGINAFATREQLDGDAYYGSKPVIGQVALWGLVHEHGRGWRAQFAAPTTLSVADDLADCDQIISDLAAWGIPVITHTRSAKSFVW